MEKEIEKLKQKYLNTPIPKSLDEKGFSDVLFRILQTNAKPHQFYYSQLVGVIILVILLFTGFVGFAQASKPGTPLYPVKKLTAEVLSKVTGKTPENVEKEINTFLDIKNPTITPTPKTQNLPKETISPQDIKKKPGKKINGDEKKQNIQSKIDDSNEAVEGVSIIKENDVSKNIRERFLEEERD